jgi:glycosyltransferase involved in cell wall biosynthesis
VDDWELVVVDDGSEDGTQEVVAPYLSDPRIRYLRQARAGRSRARNRGVSLARAELICFLDSDDAFLPTSLAAHLAALEPTGEVGLTIGGYVHVDESGAVVGTRRPWQEGGRLTPEGWLYNCYGMPGSIMVRREWFARVDGFDAETETGEDWDLFLRLAVAGCPMVWAPDIVCRRRLHRGNSTNDVRRHQHGSLRALDKLFRAADLPAELAAQEDKAKAWAHATFARDAAAAGDDELVRENLRTAAELDALPSWERRGLSLSPQGFPSLLERLVADAVERERDADSDIQELLARLPARWDLDSAVIRRGLARVEMSRFFDALARGARREAASHLRRGLRHDVRWLGNRAVISFLVKRPLRV